MDQGNDRDASDRVRRTSAYYDTFAEQVAGRIEGRDFTRAFDAFCALVVREHPVLDIGSGTGAHLVELAARGVDAVGVEPSRRMREIAAERGVRSVAGTFETLARLGLPRAGGVWCASSLLHVPVAEIPASLAAIRELLVDGAPLFATVRLGDGASWDCFDDADADVARFIQLFADGELEAAIAAAGFAIVDQWTEDSTWGRPSRWTSILARRA